MKRLIIGPAWVGDMVMAQALTRRLRRLDPEGEVHMVAPAATFPLIALMPEVARGWRLEIAHGRLQLASRLALARQLARENFDEAIILPRSFKSALVPWLAGIPRRLGALGEMRLGLINVRVRNDGATGRTVDDFVQFAGDGPLQEEERPRLIASDQGQALLTGLGVPAGARIVALCPGAEYGPAKRWPARHFGELAVRLARHGIATIVIGGPKEDALGEVVRESSGTALCHNLAGKTSLPEAIALLSRAAAVVSNDSGLMHVAAALDRPLVALYGSSSPKRTPPLSDRARVLTTDISCRPCFKRDCPLGHTDCLVKLEVARVEGAVLSALG